MTLHLSDFIRENIEPILQACEDYANSLPIMPDSVKRELRAHAKEIFMTIADDLDASRSEHEQTAKSKGFGPQDENVSSAQVYGGEHYGSGLNMLETVSEFRALRASVESLWAKTHPTISGETLEDIIRFNEAIDRALAESMEECSTLKEKDARLFEAVLTASPDPIFVLDIEGKFCFANKATADLFCLDRDTIIGESIFDLGCSFSSNFRRNLGKVIAEHNTCRGRFFHMSDSGEENQFDYQLAPVANKNHNTEATVCISRDITQQALAVNKIWHAAHHDTLTGLPNRRLFLDRLKQEVKHAKRSNRSLSVLFVDLDRFKEINDVYGHEAGDVLLRTVANRLTDCVREEDTIARLGGDEFTAIVTGVHQRKDAELVAQSIVEAIAMPIEIEKRSIHISASIGISCYLEDGTTCHELLKAADQAMYNAKKAESRVSLNS